MGCDIHDYVEVFINGSWEMVGKVFEDYYASEGESRLHEHPYDMRNYSLFGMLAGVRSDYVPTIADPRGVPKDASEDYLEIVKEWNGDGHSHSYFTLRELLDYPFYDEFAEREGCVSSNQYLVFKKEGKPNSWCGSVGGESLYHITNQEMDEYIVNPELFIKENIARLLHDKLTLARQYYPDAKTPYQLNIQQKINEAKLGVYPKQMSFYTDIKWASGISEYLGVKWFRTLDQMKEFAPDGDYNRIRMVFFFDN